MSMYSQPDQFTCCAYSIEDVKVNGSSVKLNGKAGTLFYKGLPDMVPIYEPFYSDMTELTAFCADGNIEECSGIIVDKNDFEMVKSIEVTFNAVRSPNGESLVSSEGLVYIVYPERQTTEVFCCMEDIRNVEIKPAVYGYPVVGICTGAFENRQMSNVVIPDSVTSIGGWAFWGCSSLASVVIPDGVTSISNWAFGGCTSLTDIVIPDSVTSIGYYAFRGCTNLNNVVIPDGVTSISNWAFGGCTSLTDIVIPDGISIGDGAFDGTPVADRFD